MCSTHMVGACRGQKRGSDPLELELYFVSYRVGTENWTRVLCKSTCLGMTNMARVMGQRV